MLLLRDQNAVEGPEWRRNRLPHRSSLTCPHRIHGSNSQQPERGHHHLRPKPEGLPSGLLQRRLPTVRPHASWHRCAGGIALFAMVSPLLFAMLPPPAGCCPAAAGPATPHRTAAQACLLATPPALLTGSRVTAGARSSDATAASYKGLRQTWPRCSAWPPPCTRCALESRPRRAAWCARLARQVHITSTAVQQQAMAKINNMPPNLPAGSAGPGGVCGADQLPQERRGVHQPAQVGAWRTAGRPQLGRAGRAGQGCWRIAAPGSAEHGTAPPGDLPHLPTCPTCHPRLPTPSLPPPAA